MARIVLPPLVLPPHSVTEVPPPPPPVSRLILPRQKFPTEDERVRGVSKRLASGYAETTGIRKNMEDRMTIFGSLRLREDEDYFAVFDGHNGAASAIYCAGRMHVKLCDILNQEPDPVKCLKQAFELTNEGLEKNRSAGGTTAVVSLFKGNELYIANSGDSRAVISKNRKAIRITTDHKPDVPLEKERIEKSGGWVKNGGITGTLTVSRALGDFSYKPYITCEPDVFGPYSIADKDYQLLILACDGLWDVVTDDEAVEIALNSKNPEDAAVQLRDKALKSNSKDNISVLVVYFPHYYQDPEASSSNEKVSTKAEDEISYNKFKSQRRKLGEDIKEEKCNETSKVLVEAKRDRPRTPISSSIKRPNSKKSRKTPSTPVQTKSKTAKAMKTTNGSEKKRGEKRDMRSYSDRGTDSTHKKKIEKGEDSKE